MAKQYIARIPVQAFNEDKTRLTLNLDLVVTMPFAHASRERKIRFGAALIVEQWRHGAQYLRKQAPDLGTLVRLISDEAAIRTFDMYATLYELREAIDYERDERGNLRVSVSHKLGSFFSDTVVRLNSEAEISREDLIANITSALV